MDSDLILLLPREIMVEKVIPELKGNDIIVLFAAYEEYREYLWYNT